MLAAFNWTKIKKSYTETVLRVWYAGSFQMDEDKEVPGKVLSYLYRCPPGVVCWQPPNGRG
jgi:hypothetical protein